jgi:hypothetical protein
MTGVVDQNNRMNSGNGRFRAQFWKTELCRFWRSGCRNGKLCPFAHGDEELTARPDLAKTSLCQRWAKGSCPLEATECRFAHGHLDLRATINFSQASQELEMNSQMNEPGILQAAEAPILSTGSPPPLGNQRSGQVIQPTPPRMWEEDSFSNLHAYGAGGPPADMSWASRSQNNHWNEAVLGQRGDWQWSADYGDSSAGEDARNRRGRRRPPKPTGVELGLGTSGPSVGVDPSVPSNGRPPPPPPPVPPQGLQLTHIPGHLPLNGGRPHEGLPGLTLTDSPWACGASAVANGGWPDPSQAFALPASRPPYSATMVPEQHHAFFPETHQAFKFPHAITTPEPNIMNPSVPEELRAIWG